MPIRTSLIYLASLLTLIAGGIALAITSAQSAQNPTVKLFGAPLSSYATLDAKGAVTEAGVIFALGSNTNAPAKMDMGAMYKVDAALEFPEVVRQQTYLDHLGVFWNPMGHEPDVRYGAPHWDFHFFSITPNQAAAIDCKNLMLETPTALAPGWTPTTNPSRSTEEFCVPLMGFHSLPASEFTAPGVLERGQFDKVMINGFYGGKPIFIEPMLTKALLETHQNFVLPVPMPASVGKATLYPTKFTATYDAALSAYRFVFSEFQPIN